MISIVVPIYNSSKYLDKCIKSILNQTYRDFELILVDDGSTDESYAICKHYADEDNRIKTIHKENGGQGSARNLGLDIARGEYIGFVDSDDFIHPNYYEMLIRLLNDYRADIVCCHYQFVQPDEDFQYSVLNYSDIKQNARLISTKEFLQNYDKFYHAVSWISPCTKLCKREMFFSTRFPEGKIDEDSYILHHLIGNSKRIVRVEQKLYYYVWSQNSTSRSDFSVKRFDKNGANLDRIEFFKKLGIKNQESFFKRQYLLNTLKMYYGVKNEYPKFLNDFKKYISEYRRYVWRFIKNNDKICKIEKIIYSIFAISPKMAEKLYDRYLK